MWKRELKRSPTGERPHPDGTASTADSATKAGALVIVHAGRVI